MGVVIVIFMLSIIIILAAVILILAGKLREDMISGEVELKEEKLDKLKDIDLRFVEEATAYLQEKEYSWSGDYEVKGLKGTSAAFDEREEDSVIYHARYLLNEKRGTLAAICFCEHILSDKKNIGQKCYMTALYLFSQPGGEAPVLSNLMSRKQLRGQEIEKKIQMPCREHFVYSSLQELQEMTVTHDTYCQMIEEQEGRDTELMRGELKEILTKWNQRLYNLDRRHFRYNREKEGYELIWPYAIMIVLTRLF